MKSLVALIKREFLEHKGAFLYAPTLILLVMTAFGTISIATNRFGVYGLLMGSPVFFEVVYMFVAPLWGVYLLATLFFYYADAFSADRRNNSMLFWKSMPVSDFKVLASKSLAGLTILPALIFVAYLLTGVLIAIGLMARAGSGPHVAGVLDYVGSIGQIGSFMLVTLALSLLWYAPFFAWVGLLSTLFRRWSIPLAFLIPALAGLAERMLLNLGGPREGYIISYLRERLHFGAPGNGELMGYLGSLWGEGHEGMPSPDASMQAARVSGGEMIGRLVASIDWTQMVGGLIVAALLVYAASEYRRRTLAT